MGGARTLRRTREDADHYPPVSRRHASSVVRSPRYTTLYVRSSHCRKTISTTNSMWIIPDTWAQFLRGQVDYSLYPRPRFACAESGGVDVSRLLPSCTPARAPDLTTTNTTTDTNKSLPRFALCSLGVEIMLDVFFVILVGGSTSSFSSPSLQAAGCIYPSVVFASFIARVFFGMFVVCTAVGASI